MTAPFTIPKKIALISSLAGYGRCSITEALPVLSAMKVQACPVPTAVFSNHTGFPAHFVRDFTEDMPGYLAQWKQLGFRFDGIYCGFLENRKQIGAVCAFIREQKEAAVYAPKKGNVEKGNPSPVVLVDPVMGDHGALYRTVAPDYCHVLKELIPCADILTPNITEACLLTDTPVRETGWEPAQLQSLCLKLHAFGPSQIVITGLRAQSGDLHDLYLNFISEKGPDDECVFHTVQTPSAGAGYHGTGDIFASILAADAVQNTPFLPSVQKAASFVGACIRASHELGIPETDGVCLENLLNLLV